MTVAAVKWRVASHDARVFGLSTTGWKMTTLPRLGAVALLLASVSTIAVIAHGGASAA
jgi:hypothetical protein